MKITTKDIQVGFHARQILKGISIESKDKELVGIIGPNGSGKSTYRARCPSMDGGCRSRWRVRRAGIPWVRRRPSPRARRPGPAA